MGEFRTSAQGDVVGRRRVRGEGLGFTCVTTGVVLAGRVEVAFADLARAGLRVETGAGLALLIMIIPSLRGSDRCP